MPTAILEVQNLSFSIKDKTILQNINFSVDSRKIYTIIGPNGSGKTTLLRIITRNLKPGTGQVRMNGKIIHKMPTKEVAQSMAFLTQTRTGRSDVGVWQLVSYGRFAHRDWWKGRHQEDLEIIEECIHKTGLDDMANRKISTLSGGEQQRAWIAMALAQKPKILILDEPTTFLDVSHQLEILELITDLNGTDDITVLMVLHDINHAARFSDEIIIIQEGFLYAHGDPREMLTPKSLSEVFRINADISIDRETKKPRFYAKSIIRD